MRVLNVTVTVPVETGWSGGPQIGDDGLPMTQEQAEALANQHALYEAKVIALNEATDKLMMLVIRDDLVDSDDAVVEDGLATFTFRLMVVDPNAGDPLIAAYNEGIEAARLATEGVPVIEMAARIDALKR